MLKKQLQQIALIYFIASLFILPVRADEGMAIASIADVLKEDPDVIDLSYVLNSNIPTFTAGEKEMSYENLTSVEKNGYSTGVFKMPEHFGTHIDAPIHFSKNGESIDQIDAKRLISEAVVIDIRKEARENPDYQLSKAKIEEWEKNGVIPANSIVILCSGWGERWTAPNKYRNSDNNGIMHFPGFSEEAVRFLVDKRHVVALGTDTLSIDPGNSKHYPAHGVTLSSGLYAIENLANLDKLPARGAYLFCGPLKIENGSGSPARIMAILSQD